MDQRPDSGGPEPEPIERLLARFERRLRAQHTLSGLVEGACLGLMVGGVAIAAIRTNWADPDFWWVWLVVAIALTVGGAAWRALQPIDAVDAARQIDRTHGLHDRISTAVSLARRPERNGADDAFVRAQLQDAIRHANSVDLHRAAPWRRPPDIILLGCVFVAVLAIAFLPMAEHEEPLPEPFEVRHDPVLDAATLAMERDRLEEFRRHIDDLSDEEAEALADDIEKLLDAVENREISDREFTRRIDELLDEHFGDTSEADSLEALTRALEEAAADTAADHAEAIEQHPEAERALDALQDGDFQEAADALAELSERIDDGELSPEDAEELADLLDSFSDQLDGHEDRLQDLFEQHRDRFEDLADQFEGLDGEGPGGEEQLLEDARQAMEDAADQREQFSDSEAQRQLEQLSRELDQAADDLRDGDSPDSPPDDGDSDDGRPDDAHGDDEQGDDGQPRDGQPDDSGDPRDGDQQGERDLVDQDRIDDPGDGPQQQDGDDPDYRDRPGRQLDDVSEQLEEMERQQQRQQQREQAREQLEDMQESMSRSGDDDERRGEQMEDFLDRARGEEPEVTDDGQPGEDAMPGADEDGAEQGASDQELEDGDGASTAGDDGPDAEGEGAEEEDLDFEYTEEQLEGTESGEGPSRSEVIESAGEEGFATAEYQDVYADYEAIAEEVIEREAVPDGYRHYIERYFQLIRPQQ